jgi:hypothetical protein
MFWCRQGNGMTLGRLSQFSEADATYQAKILRLVDHQTEVSSRRNEIPKKIPEPLWDGEAEESARTSRRDVGERVWQD